MAAPDVDVSGTACFWNVENLKEKVLFLIKYLW